MNNVFETLGYSIDVLDPITKKYLGCFTLPTSAQIEQFGYNSRRVEYLDMVIKKGTKKIKVQGDYILENQVLCGKVIGDRFEVLRRSKDWLN